MFKLHTKKQSARACDLRLVPGLGLVDLAGSGLPEALVGRVSGELEVFAARMHEGLLGKALGTSLGNASSCSLRGCTKVCWLRRSRSVWKCSISCSKRTSPRWRVSRAATIATGPRCVTGATRRRWRWAAG